MTSSSVGLLACRARSPSVPKTVVRPLRRRRRGANSKQGHTTTSTSSRPGLHRVKRSRPTPRNSRTDCHPFRPPPKTGGHEEAADPRPIDRSIDRSKGGPFPTAPGWGDLAWITEIGLLGRRRYDRSRGASSSGAGRRPTRGRCIAGTPCTRRAGPTTANGPLEVRYVDDWWDARSPVMVWMGEWMDAAVPGDWPL